jgi:sigma-B regulation protein RsbU (phosphoserine phosphatase)
VAKVAMPLKYKFLGVMLFVVLSALSVFMYVAQKTFTEDKKVFIMDSSRTLLKATTSEIKLELKSRMEELQQFVPRVYMGGTDKLDPFQGLDPRLVDELIGVSFLRVSEAGTFTVVKEFTNTALVDKQKLGSDFLKSLNIAHPLSSKNIDRSGGVEMINRSVHLGAADSGTDVPVLTFLLGANFINDSSKELFIAVDLAQTFLMSTLNQSEFAEVFLLFSDGRVLSHPNPKTTIAYASQPMAHPIVQKMQDKKFSRESMEIELDGEQYLCNISETGFKNVFAISQIRKAEAFLALRSLREQSMWLAILILAASTVLSVFFAAGLTTNIQKLRLAAEQVGAGNLDITLSVKSNDEIQSVAQSFKLMTNQIKTLIAETVEKGRLADELETARLVQSTLLTSPDLVSDAIEWDSHYVSASECGGDYWDARITGNLVTFFIGDATGHGVPAAIVTAVAKSCFSTLSSIYAQTPLAPEALLSEMNRIIYGACRGKLLMTMVIVQLNTETGEVLVANAGHESPFCLRKAEVSNGIDSTDKKHKPTVDVFFSRGERLGFAPEAMYQADTVQMQVGDTVLLYTDGITEAKNVDGKEFGERALKKTLGKVEDQPLGIIKTAITDDLGKFATGAKQEDDITFVLFRWKKQLEALKAA